MTVRRGYVEVKPFPHALFCMYLSLCSSDKMFGAVLVSREASVREGIGGSRGISSLNSAIYWETFS